jgi:hypothetical protein
MYLSVRIFLVLSIAMLAISCSGVAHNPVEPADVRDSAMPTFQANDNHQLWGLWQFTINPELERLDIAPLRDAQLHINALAFLEPPANLNLSIQGPPQFSGGNITVNIALTHPLAGLVQFTGFDVKGILIGHGANSLHDVPAIIFGDETNIRLLNYDGYSRWWNPEEFPLGAINHQGYIDGLMGVPDSMADYTATLNPYKYYCDFLDATADIATLPVDNRGYFTAGTTNVREFVIDYTPSGLVFNYAVDASWQAPTVPPPGTQVPDDFPFGANQAEPYRVVTHDMVNTLAYNITTHVASGALTIDVDVYDWIGAGSDIVCGYTAGGELFGACNFFPIGGGEGYSTYQIDTAPVAMDSADDILLWVAAECQEPYGYNNFIPWEVQGSYWPMTITVEEES